VLAGWGIAVVLDDAQGKKPGRRKRSPTEIKINRPLGNTRVRGASSLPGRKRKIKGGRETSFQEMKWEQVRG